MITPAGTTPGSPEWMETTLQLARDWSLYSEKDVRKLVGYLRDLRAHGWRAMVGGEDDWPKFCRDVLGHDPAFLGEMEEGCAILEAAGHKGPMSVNQAQAAKQAALDNPNTLLPHGANQTAIRDNGEEFLKNKNRNSYKGGINSSYQVQRLRRDCPEAVERLERGEFKSVAAARRWSKGEDPHPPRRAPAAFAQIKRLLPKLTEDEKDELCRLLVEEY